MKRTIKFLTVLLLSAIFAAPQIEAQTRASIKSGSARKREEANNSISVRAKALYEKEELSSSDIPWMRIIYSSLDLKKEKNLPLYYPEESTEEQENLFRLIMKLLAESKIGAYEYLDGREIFNDEYQVNVKETLDRFHILYEEKENTGSKKAKLTIDPSDVPANEVLSYYIKEKWVFDKRNSGLKSEIVAICPILHRVGDFGGEAVKYPMFWVKYSDVRPYMAQQYIITSSENNVRNYTFDDFFKLRMFDAEIYKTMNLRNMSLMQLYPEQAAQDSARREIEKQLQSFENGLWVKDIEEINKEQEAKAIEEEAKTEEVKSDKPKEVKSSIDSSRSSRGIESPKSSVSKSTKSSKPAVNKSSSKSSRSKAPKSSAPVRSVRSTK
ncbi:MAG: gliding motility protein GldN [Bacteroidales bacterium]|nr:gliding motility protein GldN [Bacteroidales bacterium]MBQ7818115.1 gliding motility protein GldN [Bacteroidales bacterium]